MKIKPLPKPYSNQWLKELRLALSNPNFKTTAPKAPMPDRYANLKDYDEKKDIRGIYHRYGGRPLTDKEWNNFVIARTLIEARENS